jgi:hypothetical protein
MDCTDNLDSSIDVGDEKERLPAPYSSQRYRIYLLPAPIILVEVMLGHGCACTRLDDANDCESW